MFLGLDIVILLWHETYQEATVNLEQNNFFSWFLSTWTTKNDDPFPVSAHLMIHISETGPDQTSLPKRGLVDSPGSVRQAAMSFHFFKSAKALLCLLALCKTFDDRGIDHLVSVNKWCCVTKIKKSHRISRRHEIRYEWFWVGATQAKSGFYDEYLIS